jgi:flagellin-like hook-associated protein FlgL
MAFNNLVSSVQSDLSAYVSTQMLIASNERIDVPSDDPTGYYKANALNSQQAAITQYLANLTQADTYLTATDDALGDLDDVLKSAQQIAEAQATETSTASGRLLAASELQTLIDQALGLANTDFQGRYLFSGYNTDSAAVSDTGMILPAYASSANTYTGTATSSGDYTGTENKTYLVRIVTGGEIGTAQYQVSEDGGTTWSTTQTVQSGENSVSTGDTDSGIRLSFTDGTFGEGDEFKVATGAGAYQGDDGSIEVNIGKHSRIATNVSGKEVFQDTGYFEALNQLKFALQNNDTDGISESLETLKSAQTALGKSTVNVGNQMTRVDVATSNLTIMQENLSSALQTIEEPDSVKSLALLAMQETALSSSTAMLAQVLPTNLFDYL